jgi:hypothetical protein
MSTTNYTVRNTKEIETIGDGMVALPISRTDGKKGKSGLCILAPVVSDSVLMLVQNDVQGKAFIINAIDDLRSKIASKLNKEGKLILSDSIGITGLLAAMRNENESQRFTKEAIASWFAEYLDPLIGAKLSARMPGIAADKLDKLVAGYCEQLQVLANRPDNRCMPNAIKEQLIKALALLPDDHESMVCEEIAARLDTIQEASIVLGALD